MDKSDQLLECVSHACALEVRNHASGVRAGEAQPRQKKAGAWLPHSKGRLGTNCSRLGPLLILCGLVLAAACRQDMHDQPRYEPLEASSFFADGRSARPLVAGTVARGDLREDEHFYTGKSNGVVVDTFPFPVTRDVLERGRERYNIFCSPCHDQGGNGQGMIVQRGFRRPSSFHTDRLREAPVGYFFEVITNGFGAMYDYADRIPPRDRWTIIAYIRALQLSQNATLEDVPSAERAQLGGAR